MTRADKILICIIMLASIVTLIPIFKNKMDSNYVTVKVSNQEVLSLDLSKDGTWDVKGTLGTVTIEIKDRKVRVVQENSPQHLCSKQGFVSSSNVPIVCLPNETVVQIEGSDEEMDTVIKRKK